MKEVSIIYTNYYDIYSQTSGAVLYSTSIFAKIIHSTFSRVYAAAAGACFYIYGASDVNIIDICCYNCCIYKSGYLNNIWGNAYYIKDSKINQSFVCTSLCSISSTYRGDSSIIFNKCYSKNANMNFSMCHEINGGTFSIIYTSQLATFSYSNIHDSVGATAYESAGTTSYLNKINFINSSKCNAIIYPIENGKVYITECVFINMAATFAKDNAVNLIVSSNCIADAQVNGLPSISASNGIKYEIHTIPIKSCKMVFSPTKRCIKGVLRLRFFR